MRFSLLEFSVMYVQKPSLKVNSLVNRLDQECFKIVKAPERCPIFGVSKPESKFWVKGDGCCEVKKDESELCDPVDDDKPKTTTQKMTTKKTTRKPSTNDVDSGLLEL